MSRRNRHSRHAIVLLIVLGMLSLFSVLVVSYVVFSTGTNQAAISNSIRRQTELFPGDAAELSLISLISGTNDHRSVTFGNSFLEDVYGIDGFAMRVGHDRDGGGGMLTPQYARGMLLRPNNGGPVRSTLFKFPTNFVNWHSDGPSGAQLGAALSTPPSDTDILPLDDVFAGREVTFEEGPLQGHTFRILRYFGIANGGTTEETNLAGCVVIDLSELPDELLEIGGELQKVYTVASTNLGTAGAGVPQSDGNRFLYNAGFDQLPGRANFDDDGDGLTDEYDELGYPNSDDFGYRFVMNGAKFNGRGQNPAGATGISRLGSSATGTLPAVSLPDVEGSIELQFNARLMGPTAVGGNQAPEQDESWDAADIENLFLSYQPSDHRRAVGQTIYFGPNAAELNRQLGQHIIPAFHRPSVINYLLNQPIVIQGEMPPNNRNFFELDGSDTNDAARLQIIVTRLRRAVLRPLNFEHLFFNFELSDLNGDGLRYDGNPGFTGSNSVPILSETIETSNPNFQVLHNQIYRLAVWLVNGPWDVDNDGDGLPDSIWTDFGLPAQQAPDGRLIKPMVSALIEDQDGLINLNHTGNLHQLTKLRHRKQNYHGFSSDPEFIAVMESAALHGQGGGIGPAEIDFSHLFDEGRVGAPQFASQLGVQLPWGSLDGAGQPTAPVTALNYLNTRYGNLMNVRYGGPIYSYIPSLYPAARFTKFPGSGDLSNAAPGSDLLARIPFPYREAVTHNPSSVAGRPMDMSAVMVVAKDAQGHPRFAAENSVNVGSGLPLGTDDIVNQPYEFGSDEVRGDDTPFTISEHVDFVTAGRMSGRLTELLGDEADRNPALRRLLTTESRSFDTPETIGALSMVHVMAQKMNTTGSKQPHLDRMLAVELRRGSKLNLNRPLGNGQDSGGAVLVDESAETATRLTTTSGAADPNLPNNRFSAEPAFPMISGRFPSQAAVNANYTPITLPQNDFDGFDIDGDGVLDVGQDINGDGFRDKIPDGNELLARHLYCLMFSLLVEPPPTTPPPSPIELVPNFPYPTNFNPPPTLTTTSIEIKNQYVARRLAQWAVNAVDYRDADSRCTRLRYDPDPFDTNGFDLATAADNTVWGMERPELELTENMSFHDKRLKRNLLKQEDPMNPGFTLDGQLTNDEDPDNMDADLPDEDMDQFRTPQASTYVELRAMAPLVASGFQPSLPRELYTNNRLDLGRTVGGGASFSPVWRLAVGQPTGPDREKSTRWVYDAERLGRELVANQGRTEEFDYLNGTWGTAADVTAEVDTWNEVVRHSAEVRNSFSGTDAFVTIADDDFDPTNDAGSNYRIRLERFVWFTTQQPDVAMRVITDPSSGMRRDNVFYRKGHPAAPGDLSQPENALPLLEPGQYAVVAPRAITHLGQTTMSNSTNNYEYHPADQRFAFDNVPAPGALRFRLNYFGHGDLPTQPQTPLYETTALPDHDVGPVIPIIAQSLFPNETGTANPQWDAYINGTPITPPIAQPIPEERVDMGFNISAPLPDATYYPAPGYKIRTAGTPYPLQDGYRDYDAGNGFHPDVPFDHVAGTPMEQNGWNAVGTHQDVRTIFLQRLADPATPWDPVDNPYVTVDFMPMDLTTFNGEEDIRTLIDRNGDGAVDDQPDNESNYNVGTQQFTPALRMDSRRKIPDFTRDRVTSQLMPQVTVPVTPPAPPSLANFQRVSMAMRSPLSASFNVLRNASDGTIPGVYWPYEYDSMWDNGALATGVADLDSTYRLNQQVDTLADPFRQSLGFLNREFGHPVRSTHPKATSFFVGVGNPHECLLNLPTWMDRDYQSPLELMNVPATSRTGLLTQFSPGTLLQDAGRREIVNVFRHLLGFEAGYALDRPADHQPLTAPGPTGMVADHTGDRAGFEQIFDYVNIGPVGPDDAKWIDPNQVRAIRTVNINVPANDPAEAVRAPMFNRVVEILQPPFNFIDRQRKPGRINPNTMRDYIRRGPSFNGGPDEFLDANEAPNAPGTSGAPAAVFSQRIRYSPYRPNASQASFTEYNATNGWYTGANLFASGSTYRSLTWGISNFYELNDLPAPEDVSNVGLLGQPGLIGERDLYSATVDTRFGHEFKAFIESRRGYADSQQRVVAGNPAWLFNPELDARYPTRFAGVFAPAQAAAVPSVQRFMRPEDGDGLGVRRRTHDMGLMRTHPDFDERLMTNAQRTNLAVDTDTSFSLRLEDVPASSRLTSVGWANANPASTAAPMPPTEVVDLRMPIANKGLFERSQAELNSQFRHINRHGEVFYRNMARDSFYRFHNAAKLSNLTTNHSNVFMVRMTIGYFVVDPITGAVGAEYVDDTGKHKRSKSTYVIDRSVPVGFLRGRQLNSLNTVIYASEDE
ncbi:hypothetical protein [Stieleria varia]|uniref:Uncharacterized protein n=1 Tax=Stieleria varia TaxID=2528005 RepID=A0A5C6B8M7_9BACT|nr:hypothetical protein [Stieleria varia]TWU07649.1 hypothetical protein Pla52n_02220 [Stieleria varia]